MNTPLITEMQNKLKELPELLKDLPVAEREKIMDHYEASIDYLEFVERWAVHHAKRHPEGACLESIQYYPTTIETTKSYTSEERPPMTAKQAESLILKLKHIEPEIHNYLNSQKAGTKPSSQPGDAFS